MSGNFAPGALRRLNPDGTVDNTFNPTFSMAVPLGLAFDKSGNLFVSHDILNGGISKIAPDGTVSVFASSGLNFGRDLAFSADGNLYALNRSGRTVIKYLPDGTASAFATLTQFPAGLTFDRSGNLYVALDGGDVDKIAPNGAISLFASTGALFVDSPRFDASGNLFLTAHDDSKVLKISSSGAVSVFANLDRPNALTFDVAGNLYVSDDLTSIFKYNANGTATTYANGLSRPLYMAFAPSVSAAAPEPSSFTLMALVTLGVGGVAARRRK